MPKSALPIEPMMESEDEFGAAYQSFSQRIYRYFYGRTGSRELSEDLTSHVFEKAWRSRRSFHGGSAQAWLYRIARNLLIDHWRSKQELAVEDMDPVMEATADSSEQLDLQMEVARLQRALAKLPDDMQTIVRLRFIEQLPVRQVAQRCHISESNVRVMQYRALRKLKDYLDD